MLEHLTKDVLFISVVRFYQVREPDFELIFLTGSKKATLFLFRLSQLAIISCIVALLRNIGRLMRLRMARISAIFFS